MTIRKRIDKGDLITFRTYDLHWKGIGGYYAVSISWYSVQTLDSYKNRTWVLLTPKAGKVVSIETASLHDALALVKLFGGDVNER